MIATTLIYNDNDNNCKNEYGNYDSDVDDDGDDV